jgi:hypothetical protein
VNVCGHRTRRGGRERDNGEPRQDGCALHPVCVTLSHRLSKLPGLESLRLAAWAHMLGFRGHFSTKSHTYSITLGALRAAYQREQAIAAGLMPDLAPDSTLVLAQWHFAGRGHPLIAPPGPLDPPPGDLRDGSHREGVDDVA